MLACPITKTPLQYDADKHQLISEQAGLAFPIKDGIFHLLPSDAIVIKRVKGNEPVEEDQIRAA
jgi:uncharacterized protein YbaR (Trm112 family)